MLNIVVVVAVIVVVVVIVGVIVVAANATRVSSRSSHCGEYHNCS